MIVSFKNQVQIYKKPTINLISILIRIGDTTCRKKIQKFSPRRHKEKRSNRKGRRVLRRGREGLMLYLNLCGLGVCFAIFAVKYHCGK
jgi:hypothetical protein